VRVSVAGATRTSENSSDRLARRGETRRARKPRESMTAAAALRPWRTFISVVRRFSVESCCTSCGRLTCSSSNLRTLVAS
jgi:hypothetical protein